MITEQKKRELRLSAIELRMKILDCIGAAGGGHVGGSMSVIDCLAALYCGIARVRPEDAEWPDRDKIILSKGHSGPALYAALAYRGFIDDEMLRTMNNNGTSLPSHTNRMKTPGVEMTSGSLGQGASFAAGIAYADYLNGRDSRSYVILGDGELNEGQIWEALLFISHHKMKNLVVIVDQNELQCMAPTTQTCDLGSLENKFSAFGFRAIGVEKGNDAAEIYAALEEAAQERERAVAIVLHTKKGAGLPMFEGKVSCHYCVMDQNAYDVCMAKLQKDWEDLQGGKLCLHC